MRTALGVCGGELGWGVGGSAHDGTAAAQNTGGVRAPAPLPGGLRPCCRHLSVFLSPRPSLSLVSQAWASGAHAQTRACTHARSAYHPSSPHVQAQARERAARSQRGPASERAQSNPSSPLSALSCCSMPLAALFTTDWGGVGGRGARRVCGQGGCVGEEGVWMGLPPLRTQLPPNTRGHPPPLPPS